MKLNGLDVSQTASCVLNPFTFCAGDCYMNNKSKQIEKAKVNKNLPW